MEKKLFRSREDKVIAGIAGGLGDYLNIDPIILRIIMVIITIFYGIGLLVYIVMWIIIPEAPFNFNFNSDSNTNDTSNENQDMGENSSSKAEQEIHDALNAQQSSNGRVVVGAILIGLGLVFLFDRFLPSFDFELVVSIGFIVLGIALIFNFFNKSEKPV